MSQGVPVSPVADHHPARPVVVVVGGGIAGLAAAWELTGGAERPEPGTAQGSDPGAAWTAGSPKVVMVEAADRLGGKLHTVAVGGRPVDVGPDSMLGRRPEAAALCREVGLGSTLQPIGASGAAVWARGKRRPLPSGLFLGVPTRLLPVARSGILSPLGTARLTVDLLFPRPDRRGPLGDRAIGPLVTRKLGRQAVERLVEPLLGGIYAGGVSDASAAAVLPPLLEVSQGRASFMRSMGRLARSGTAVPGPAPGPPSAESPQPAPEAATPLADVPAPAFWALHDGFASLVDRLVSALTGRGVRIETGCAASALARDGQRWRVETTLGTIEADGVVLAVPAGPASLLLAPLDADAASLLQTVTYAPVAVVTLAYPVGALPKDLHGTGLLVPKGTPLPAVSAASLGAPDGDRCMVTACTYLSTKWPHLARPGELLVRASVGRHGDDRFAALDDDALASRVAGELAGLLGTETRPSSTLVTRWPDALPQYRVHHLLRVGGVESAVRRLGALGVAGAAYRGVGIPACIASGRSAARAVLEHLRGGVGDAATAGVTQPAP